MVNEMKNEKNNIIIYLFECKTSTILITATKNISTSKTSKHQTIKYI